jgi:hypothetical protein
LNKLKELDWKSLDTVGGEDIELSKLEEWASQCRDVGGTRALEIGSYHGKSTTILAQFFNPLYAVDLWGDMLDGINHYCDIGQVHFVPFISNMIKLKLIDLVIPLVGTSEMLQLFPFLNIDFIYIDGSHHYDDVKKDLNCAHVHLSNLGVIVGDEYKRPGFGYPPFDPNHPHHGPIDPWSGVAKAFGEFLIEHPEFYIKEHFLGKVLISRR